MENQQTVGNTFKTLNILHIAFCAGLALMLIMARMSIHKEGLAAADSILLVQIVGGALAFVAVLAARFLFFIRTQPAQAMKLMGDKLAVFRSAFVLQMALLEAPAIFNIILYFIWKNDLNFFIALGILLLMAFRRPTRVIAAMTLFRSDEDVQQVYNDELKI